MRNNRKGALPDNRQGSPVLSARQHAAAAQPRPPRTVTYPSAEQAQPPQHLGIHIPHRPDASDHPTDAGHCLTSPPGPYAPTPRRNSPAPFKTLPCRRTTVPPFRRLGTPRRHRATPRRRAPTLQLPDATLPPHSRHTPAAAHQLHTVPTPRTTPLTQEHAPRRALPHLAAGPLRSNSPSQLARSIQDTPLPPHNGSTVPTPRNTPPTPGHASPPGSNAPTPRRNAPAPFKAYPCSRTPAPHRSDASNHPADTGTRPAPSTTSPHRRSPMLQLPVATRPPHSRHTPAAAQRFHRPDASDNPADTGTRHAPGTASPHRRDPTLQHSAATRQRHSRHFPTAAQRPPHHPDASNHPAGAGFNRTAGHKKIRLCEPDLFICQ